MSMYCRCVFFKDTATTEIYTLSLHDALPISVHRPRSSVDPVKSSERAPKHDVFGASTRTVTLLYPRAPRASVTVSRSEEHTSELQSRQYLVCRLLLEKKKNTYRRLTIATSSA